MKKVVLQALVAACLLVGSFEAIAQKVGFVSSETIRENFLEAKQAEQRVQSIVDEWKRELAAMQQSIENLDFEIRKNRLIWTDTERSMKEKELQELQKNREAYAKVKFEPSGEYDQVVKEVMKPIESKIYAAVQEVAASDGFDIIWDQSTQPLAYVNFKYDITVKVLRKLGVDVAELEKELNDKIKKDPRNEVKESTKPRRRSRSQRSNETETQEKVDEKTDEKPNGEGAKPVDPSAPEREFERKK